jgi:hypothetical protein
MKKYTAIAAVLAVCSTALPASAQTSGMCAEQGVGGNGAWKYQVMLTEVAGQPDQYKALAKLIVQSDSSKSAGLYQPAANNRNIPAQILFQMDKVKSRTDDSIADMPQFDGLMTQLPAVNTSLRMMGLVATYTFDKNGKIKRDGAGEPAVNPESYIYLTQGELDIRNGSVATEVGPEGGAALPNSVLDQLSGPTLAVADMFTKEDWAPTLVAVLTKLEPDGKTPGYTYTWGGLRMHAAAEDVRSNLEKLYGLMNSKECKPLPAR